MHPVSPARVTMMENNNLLLYKLLCKDKVGGVGRGGGMGGAVYSWERKEEKWDEGKKAVGVLIKGANVPF